MMKVQFLPKFRVDSVIHILSGLTFEYGEVKEVDDNLTVRVKTNGVSHYVNLCQEFLGDRNFINASLGHNENYWCYLCKTNTDTETIQHPYNPEVWIPLYHNDKRICVNCYNELPKTILPNSIEFISANMHEEV